MNCCADCIFQSMVFTMSACMVQAVTKKLDIASEAGVFRSDHSYTRESQLMSSLADFAQCEILDELLGTAARLHAVTRDLESKCRGGGCFCGHEPS
jgi:hypothetical protein